MFSLPKENDEEEKDNIGDEILQYRSKLVRLTGHSIKKRLKKLVGELAVKTQSPPTATAAQQGKKTNHPSDDNSERVHKKQKLK